jgi:hypothetical protein
MEIQIGAPGFAQQAASRKMTRTPAMSLPPPFQILR